MVNNNGNSLYGKRTEIGFLEYLKQVIGNSFRRSIFLPGFRKDSAYVDNLQLEKWNKHTELRKHFARTFQIHTLQG